LLAVTVVLAALVTALGAIIVAMVGVLGSRTETRDTRSRILKDLEILSKLDSDSKARKTMDGHIAKTVENLTRQETRREDYRKSRRPASIGILFSIGTLALTWFAYPPPHGNYRPVLQMLYWMSTSYAVVFVATAIYQLIRARKSRARRKRDDVEPPSIAK
jgi:Flp pilus assembly protein TadB